MSRRSSCNGSFVGGEHEGSVNKNPNVPFSPNQNFKNNAFNLAKILNNDIHIESGGETDRQELSNINKTKINARADTLSPTPMNQGIRGQAIGP